MQFSSKNVIASTLAVTMMMTFSMSTQALAESEDKVSLPKLLSKTVYQYIFVAYLLIKLINLYIRAIT